MSARVALVGALGYGLTYRRQIFQHGEIEGIGELVAAIDPRHAEIPADDELRRRGVACYASLADFLAVDRADLVIIATPIHTHLPLTRQAVASGADVLLEKPLCATPEEARELVTLTAGPSRIAIGYQWSYAPCMRRLKADVMAGRLGRPQDFQVYALWPRDRAYYNRAAWAGRLHLDDGTPVFDSPMNNACAHFLFNMLWLLGADEPSAAVPATVRAALGRANPIQGCDTCLLEITTADGVPLRFAATHSVAAPMRGPIITYRFSEATVTYPVGGQVVADFADGHREEYGDLGLGASSKIAACLQARNGAAPAPCSVLAASMQTAVIATAHGSPIHQAPPELVTDPGDGTANVVDGLAETIVTAMATGHMPTLDWAPQSAAMGCDPAVVAG